MFLLIKQPQTTSNLLYGWDVKFSSIYIGMCSDMVSVGLVQGAILLGVIVCIYNNLVQSRSHCLVAVIPVLSLLHSFCSFSTMFSGIGVLLQLSDCRLNAALSLHNNGTVTKTST